MHAVFNNEVGTMELLSWRRQRVTDASPAVLYLLSSALRSMLGLTCSVSFNTVLQRKELNVQGLEGQENDVSGNTTLMIPRIRVIAPPPPQMPAADTWRNPAPAMGRSSTFLLPAPPFPRYNHRSSAQ